MRTHIDKVVVGGTAGPAMAGPLFLAENGFGPTPFSADYIFLPGNFSADKILSNNQLILITKASIGQCFVCLGV